MPYAVWYTTHSPDNPSGWGRANMYISVRNPRTGILHAPWQGPQGSFSIPSLNERGQFNLRVEAHAYALWRVENGAIWTTWEIREEELFP